VILEPPIEPMLAALGDGLPAGDGWLFEPKWDGFRAIVFRDGARLYLQSRDLKPLDRYFPDLAAPLLAALPERSVVDGEIVIATGHGLDFDALMGKSRSKASSATEESLLFEPNAIRDDQMILDPEKDEDEPLDYETRRTGRILVQVSIRLQVGLGDTLHHPAVSEQRDQELISGQSDRKRPVWRRYVDQGSQPADLEPKDRPEGKRPSLEVGSIEVPECLLTAGGSLRPVSSLIKDIREYIMVID